MRCLEQMRSVFDVIGAIPYPQREGTMGGKCWTALSEYLLEVYPVQCKEQSLTVLEIGTKKAMTASVLACYGTVLTVDVRTYDGTQDYLFCIEPEIRNRITRLITSNPLAFLREHFREIQFDVVLIDGDHSYEQCKLDTEFACEHTPVIVWHDYHEGKFRGVYNAVNECKKTRFMQRENCSLVLGVL